MKNKVTIIIAFIVIAVGVLIYCNKSIFSEYIFHKIDQRLDYERSQEVGDDFNKISWGDLTGLMNTMIGMQLKMELMLTSRG